MAVVRDNSQQTTASVNVVDSDGTRKTVASATCHIRPNKGMSINVDILDDAASATDNAEDVRAIIAAYIAEEIAKAAALGIPVVASTCPVDRTSKRAEVKALIARLSRDYPDFKSKVFGAIKRLPLDGWGAEAEGAD